jgi:hypothetical protein
MAETAPTEEIGRMVADEIFAKFGWKQCGPYNQNFSCVEHEKHRKKKTKTHPGDVIFRFPDPYLGMDVYLHADLKSYAKSTIEKANLKSILRDLAITVECANKSPQWTNLYDQTSGNHVVHGLLFIYNHDQEYDKKFPLVLQQIGDGISQLPEGKRIFVIGPERALYLYNVASDIIYLQGSQKIPFDESISFFHPDLENTRIQTKQYGPATIEMLLSPWQVLFHRDKSSRRIEHGHVIYYAGSGQSAEEFLYLLDYVFTYQLHDDEGSILIRLPNGVAEAANIFEKAKTRYGEEYWSVQADSQHNFQERLSRITCSLTAKRIPQFSTIEIGLKRNG